MRDIAVTLALFVPLLWALRAPWIGLLVWVVVSILNPHRYTYGFAFSLPFALAAAAAVFAGLLFSKDEKESPINVFSVILVLLFGWMGLSSALAYFPSASFVRFYDILKVYLMIIMASVLIVNEKQIRAMLWVLALSIGIVSAKGGVFTLLTGGSYRVWGPPSSMVEDNNAFAVAAIMIVPLCTFLSSELKNGWVKKGMLAVAVFSVFSALGSHSRGGLLAISAMGGFLWMKSRHKLRMLLALVVLVPAALMFMPEAWFERMNTIENYQEDGSAMGRINAWQTALNVANHKLTGAGFDFANPHVFSLFAPDPTEPRVAHSIYFQILGELGWPGLILFLSFWWMSWIFCKRVIKISKTLKDLEWMGNLARMIQVSLIAYLVGGAFLNIAYFELPYYETMLVFSMHRLLVKRQKLAENEHAEKIDSRMLGKVST